jgi:hypothetical protein
MCIRDSPKPQTPNPKPQKTLRGFEIRKNLKTISWMNL